MSGHGLPQVKGVAMRRPAETMSRDQLHGWVAPGFEPVRQAFADNFAQRGELGAACAVYRHGEPVVDLWGGLRDRDCPGVKAPWSWSSA
jgi:hypothetical protein